MEADTLALAQGIDFSLWGLFARATILVKLVMIMLIVASFWSWAIIVRKLISYRAARAEAARFDERFWSGEPLDELFDEIGPEPRGSAEKIFAAGMTEWRRSHRDDGGLIAGATARIDRTRKRKSCKKVCLFWRQSGRRRLLSVCSGRSWGS